MQSKKEILESLQKEAYLLPAIAAGGGFLLKTLLPMFAWGYASDLAERKLWRGKADVNKHLAAAAKAKLGTPLYKRWGAVTAGALAGLAGSGAVSWGLDKLTPKSPVMKAQQEYFKKYPHRASYGDWSTMAQTLAQSDPQRYARLRAAEYQALNQAAQQGVLNNWSAQDLNSAYSFLNTRPKQAIPTVAQRPRYPQTQRVDTSRNLGRPGSYSHNAISQYRQQYPAQTYGNFR